MFLLEKINFEIKERESLELGLVDIKSKHFVFLKNFRIKQTVKKIKILDISLFTLIDKYLFSTDSDYQKIANENYELLINPKIVYRVYQTNIAGNGRYTQKLKGKLHTNGVDYLYENDNHYYSRSSYDTQFPSKLTGTINHFGEIQLKTVEVKSKIFKKLPKSYHGTVSKNGVIELNIIEEKNEFDFFGNGSLCIDKLIGDHFNSDERKILKFHENIEKMQKRINEFKLSLRQENKSAEKLA